MVITNIYLEEVISSRTEAERGEVDLLDPHSFLPIILASAADLASLMLKERGDGAAISVHPTLAAVKLRFPAGFSCTKEQCGAQLELVNDSAAGRCGNSVFAALHLVKQTLILEVDDGFMLAFAEKAARCYRHSLGESVAVPKGGAAADSEASAYARSRLYANSKTAACAHKPEARNALFRCLCLFSAEMIALTDAHSSAVRAALDACSSGALGSVDSAAMAAALLYAETPQKIKEIKE